jgi:hypothetical protein
MKSARLLIVPLAALLAAPLVGEEKKEEKKPDAAAPAAAAPDKDAVMKAWMDAGKPGEPHKKLAAMEGSWTVKVKSQMDPSAPAEETEGTAEMKMILGGRYLEQKYEGKMMGQPFSGVGWTAYDNIKKKYVSTWVDNTATGVMVMYGSYDKSGKVLTSWGTYDDAVTKKATKMKEVLTEVDADTAKFEMHMPGPDGKLYKGLEMVYKRKK